MTIHKISEHLYFDIARHHSEDKKGIHCFGMSPEDLAPIIETVYGLKDLDQYDIPNDDDFETPEYYHFEVVDDLKYTYFLLRWRDKN